jgi:hypothetical protein
MTQLRDLIEKLAAIQEDRPAKGDGIYLEFGDTLCVESEIVEITESGDYIIHGDDRVLAMLESLTNLYEETAEEKKARWLKHDDTLFHRSGILKPTARQQATSQNRDARLQAEKNAEDARLQAEYDAKVTFKIDRLTVPQPTVDRIVNNLETQFPFFTAVTEYNPATDRYEYAFTGKAGDLIKHTAELAAYGKIIKVPATTALPEAEYHGRKVPLGKPMQGDVKKSKVYVKNPATGKVIKVNFGDKKMRIKKSIPGRRKNFRARHNCANPGPRTKARYWSCRAW